MRQLLNKGIYQLNGTIRPNTRVNTDLIKLN